MEHCVLEHDGMLKIGRGGFLTNAVFDTVSYLLLSLAVVRMQRTVIKEQGIISDFYTFE